MIKGAKLNPNATDNDIAIMERALEGTRYTVKPNGTIDVMGSVNVWNNTFKNLPYYFNHISGCFDLYGCRLTSLEGCAISVGGYFDIARNEIYSLMGMPNTIGGHFYCQDCLLTYNLKYIKKHCHHIDGCIKISSEKYLYFSGEVLYCR